jgi:cyclopropane-fatty-acyl-phospholipid synthase
MLYKFQSRAASDLLMLEPQGRRILQIIGKHGEDRRGILRPGDMLAAIAALESAILREEQEAAEAQTEDAEDDAEQAVSLRQRAAPFIDMLRHSRTADADVVWGV